LQIEKINLRFLATNSSGEVSAILLKPQNAKCLLVLGHGAGAGMKSAFMENIARSLAEQDIATFRYNFPYIEQGKKAPNPPPILKKTIVSAVEEAKKHAGSLPLLAGGKSLGGRITSIVAAEGLLTSVKGLVFFGFPLHAPGKPSTDRADHLKIIKIPMLFLQGTRDKLANLDLLKPICRKLDNKVTLQIFEGGDHSFHVPKRSGKSDEQVTDELANTVASWLSNWPKF